MDVIVSTHSRAKAAASSQFVVTGIIRSFNTQPREGGCQCGKTERQRRRSFNTQPREGGCTQANKVSGLIGIVSTHSRAKAAADYLNAKGYAITWFQHTAARRRLQCKLKIVLFCCLVSTHSRAKAAAIEKILLKSITYGFNTQPREGGCRVKAK